MTVKIDRYDEAGLAIDPVELIFGTICIECATPYCGKGFDVVGHRAVHLNRLFEEMVCIHRGGKVFFSNAHGAICPYCQLTTPYSFEIKDISFSIADTSGNIVALSCITPAGEVQYKRNTEDVTDDPNFNFLENINKGENAYFYDHENQTQSVYVYEAHFIPEGKWCTASPLSEDDSGYTEDIIVNGPLAVLKHATLVTSNKNVFFCEDVYDANGEELIAPGGDPDLFKDRLIICGENAPKWTRVRQTSQGGIDDR